MHYKMAPNLVEKNLRVLVDQTSRSTSQNNTQTKIDKRKSYKNKIKISKKMLKLKLSNLVDNFPATMPKTCCIKFVLQVYKLCTRNIV